MGKYFEQAEVFPIIARVITQKYEELNRYVTHEEIAEGLLKDDEGRHEIEKALLVHRQKSEFAENIGFPGWLPI